MSHSLRIIYAGTPDFSVAALQALIESEHEVVAVYTQPDRPAGRGRGLAISPVKERAQLHNIPVYQPESLKEESAQQQLKALNADLMVVTAYGLLLPPEVLQMPVLGCINIHASLLPRWRGAAPIQRAILAGDEKTGITIMQMDEGLDTGDMLLKLTTPIERHDTGGSLHDRLANLGGEAILLALSKERKHGYAILKDVEALSEGRVVLSTGTLYGALARLLEQGVIRKSSDDPGEDSAGSKSRSGSADVRERKYYELTQFGRRVLEVEINRMGTILATAGRELGEEGI